MCQYNFILTTKSTSKEILEPILSSNGFGFSELANESVSGQIKELDKAIMTTKGHCDCGSILGIDQFAHSQEIDLERERKKLKKKKWSASKIERYLADKLKSQVQNEENRELGNKAEEERWNSAIEQMVDSGIKFGLFHHQFSGLLEDEVLNLRESKRIGIKELKIQDLRTMEEDELIRISGMKKHAHNNGS